MTTHQFIVSVVVAGEPEAGRDTKDYAMAALNMASLPDAGQLDGYADLPWSADLEVTCEI